MGSFTEGMGPAVKNLGGNAYPDSRIKWPKSGVFSEF